MLYGDSLCYTALTSELAAGTPCTRVSGELFSACCLRENVTPERNTFSRIFTFFIFYNSLEDAHLEVGRKSSNLKGPRDLWPTG